MGKLQDVTFKARNTRDDFSYLHDCTSTSMFLSKFHFIVLKFEFNLNHILIFEIQSGILFSFMFYVAF